MTTSRPQRTCAATRRGRIHQPWQDWTRRRNATGVRSDVRKWLCSPGGPFVILDRVENAASASGRRRCEGPGAPKVVKDGLGRVHASSQLENTTHARSRRQRSESRLQGGSGNGDANIDQNSDGHGWNKRCGEAIQFNIQFTIMVNVPRAGLDKRRHNVCRDATAAPRLEPRSSACTCWCVTDTGLGRDIDDSGIRITDVKLYHTAGKITGSIE